MIKMSADFFFWSFFVFLTLKIQSSFCAVITSPPQSVTVLLNEEIARERVNFTCKGTGDALIWLVASESPTDLHNQERNITVTNTSTVTGNLSSVLTMAVLPINDGVEITCQIISLSNPSKPDTSGCTLTIRGILPVDSIQWFTEMQTLSWSPPFFSSDIPQGESLVYNVLVDGISIINTTDTSIELTNSLANVLCTNFTVSLTASAYVYMSEEKQEVIDNTGNYTVRINYSSTSNFDRASGAFNVNLIINSTDPLCNTTISGKLTPDEGIIQDEHYIITDQEHENFPYTFTGLKPCGHIYTAEIEIIDSLGVMKDRDDIIIITPSPEVQDVLVSSEGYTNGSVSVQCVFVSGSTADGCHVIFTDITNGRNESYNITGLDNTTISLSTSGHYTVTVYDIINGNIIPWSCVKSKGVTVTSVTPISTTSIHTSNSGTASVSSFIVSSASNVMTSPSTGTESSGGSTTGNGYIIHVIPVSIACVLVLLIIIITSCLIIRKRQVRKKRVVLNAEHADCHQALANNNKCKKITSHVHVTPTPTGITSLLTPSTSLEDPHHVTNDAEQDRSPVTTTTTIPSTEEEQSYNSSGFSSYLDNHEIYLSSSSTDHHNATSAKNDTPTSAVVIVDSNGAVNDITAPVNPLTAVQPVMYSKVAEDVTKRGVVNVYPHDNYDLSTIDDVHITIDKEDTESNDLFEAPPPHEATLSRPQQEITQPDSNNTQFVSLQVSAEYHDIDNKSSELVLGDSNKMIFMMHNCTTPIN